MIQLLCDMAKQIIKLKKTDVNQAVFAVCAIRSGKKEAGRRFRTDSRSPKFKAPRIRKILERIRTMI